MYEYDCDEGSFQVGCGMVTIVRRVGIDCYPKCSNDVNILVFLRR